MNIYYSWKEKIIENVTAKVNNRFNVTISDNILFIILKNIL